MKKMPRRESLKLLRGALCEPKRNDQKDELTSFPDEGSRIEKLLYAAKMLDDVKVERTEEQILMLSKIWRGEG